MIKNNFKLIGTLILCGTLLLPSTSLAQDISIADVVPMESVVATQLVEKIIPPTIIIESVEADATQSTDTTSQGSISPQDSTVEEDVVLSSTIEDTFDPHNTSTPPSTSSSTVVVIEEVVVDPVVINTEVEALPNPPAPTEEVLPVATVTITEIMDPNLNNPNQVASLEVIREPESKFTFEVEGSAIATKKIPDWNRVKQNTKKTVALVTEAPTLSADNVEGVLDISGNCQDTYFVVLVYANKEDYDKSPSSYIFNKAFDCTNGRYAYSLKDLPPSLKDGTYYLLIGGQGDKGSWSPITSLTPVGITERND